MPSPTSSIGFFGGLGFFFKGFVLLFKTPGALPLALVPIGAALAIFSGFAAIFAIFVPGWIEGWVGNVGWWVPVLQVVATALALAVGVLLAMVLAQPASGPALEGIVRRVAKEIGAPPQPESGSFFGEIARSAGSAAIGLGAAVTISFVLTLIGLLPGAAVVTVPLNLVATTFCIGWDVCDYPQSVRGVPLGERVRFIFQNAKPVLGFSAGLALSTLLPCGFLVVLPVGVAGATAMIHAMTAVEHPMKTRVG